MAQTSAQMWSPYKALMEEGGKGKQAQKDRLSKSLKTRLIMQAEGKRVYLKNRTAISINTVIINIGYAKFMCGASFDCTHF